MPDLPLARGPKLKDMNRFTFTAADEADTSRLGAALAEVLPGGTIVALSGTLGAGKTRLVQAMAEALGIGRGQVVSPTFVLIQEYHGRKSLYHIDAYRLRDEAEFLALGTDEYFESEGLVLIEWADRVAGCLPQERVNINIEVIGENRRRFNISAIGEKYSPALVDLAGKIEPSSGFSPKS
jgi:tRNA threonylcarbamoyladenosine biosynthesis protein TsaE